MGSALPADPAAPSCAVVLYGRARGEGKGREVRGKRVEGAWLGGEVVEGKLVLVVQEIRTTWTKASRGGIEAGVRNSVPETAEIPWLPIAQPGLPVILHRLTYSEPNFSMPERNLVEVATLPVRLVGVTVELVGEEARATFQWTTSCGAPRRERVRQTLVIQPGEWSQIVYNGRTGGRGEWRYLKVVVNVGLFSSVARDVFTGSEPAERFASLAHLR